MTEIHPSNGHQIMTEPFSKTRRVTEASERGAIGRGGPPCPREKFAQMQTVRPPTIIRIRLKDIMNNINLRKITNSFQD
ncbi:MAG TPA: hypothetical protein VNM37_00725, partial [Candidatus Dormibacteraeota bacterium]|nr:hypothetical protein [Candidatus Dormibacteraeota bacterium]